MTRRLFFSGKNSRSLDDDRRIRHILIGAYVTGACLADLVDNLHALNDLAKDTVSPSLGRPRFKFKKIVIVWMLMFD